MNLSGLFADLAVVAIVLACLWRAIRELTPSLHRRILTRLRRAAGMPLAAPAAGGASCDSGCGPCKGCGKGDATRPALEQPLQFQPRKR